jgi:hypothetical protein
MHGLLADRRRAWPISHPCRPRSQNLYIHLRDGYFDECIRCMCAWALASNV